MKYHVELRFNSRLRGAGQVLCAEVEALSVQDAIDKASAAAVRLPDHGQSIFVVGATVDELR